MKTFKGKVFTMVIVMFKHKIQDVYSLLAPQRQINNKH